MPKVRVPEITARERWDAVELFRYDWNMMSLVDTVNGYPYRPISHAEAETLWEQLGPHTGDSNPA